jgi:hypothetical protein
VQTYVDLCKNTNIPDVPVRLVKVKTAANGR